MVAFDLERLLQVDEIDSGLVAEVAMSSVSDVDRGCAVIVVSAIETDSEVSTVDASFSPHSCPIHRHQCTESMTEVYEILD